MGIRCSSLVWIVLLALIGDAASAQTPVAPRTIKKLQPSADLRLPPYSETLLEITAERLAKLQRAVSDRTDPAAQKAKQDQAAAKRSEWERCLANASAQGAVSTPAPTQAGMQDNTAALQKLASEYVPKLQNAKTAEEKRTIAQEFAAKQQALLAPTMKASAAQASADQANRDKLTSKCGGAPPVPTSSDAQQVRLDRPTELMIERVFGYCKAEGKWYVAKDGAVSSSESPYRDDDKGSMWYNTEVYSPAEGRVLTDRCATIVPFLEAHGLKYWVRPE